MGRPYLARDAARKAAERMAPRGAGRELAYVKEFTVAATARDRPGRGRTCRSPGGRVLAVDALPAADRQAGIGRWGTPDQLPVNGRCLTDLPE